MRALLVLTLAGCLVVSGAAFSETASARSQAQSKSQSTAATVKNKRVQGTVPAGKTRIKKSRVERMPLRPSEGQAEEA